MALKNSRSGREYDKFVADSSGDTALNVVVADGITIETGEIEIGAVELKNKDTDDRAYIDTAGSLSVNQKDGTLQAKGLDVVGADSYTTVLTPTANASHIMISLEGSNDAIISLDAGTTDQINVPANSVVVLDDVSITSGTAIQGKNATGGSNYSTLNISIW